MSHLLAIFLFLAALASPLPVRGQTAGAEPLVGAWFGWAIPAIQFQAPFDQVRFEVSFFEDGTAYWNDGHELRFGHGTGHGAWEKVGTNGFESTFLWIAFDTTNASGAGNIFKLRFSGNVEGDALTNGTLNLTIFPPGTDPLDPDDTGGNPVFGTFNVDYAQRIKLDPPRSDLADVPPPHLGSWFGKAVPEDPSTAPFPEVVMMLNFLPDHNIVATDVFELAVPHVTAHGGPWVITDDGTVRGNFLWTNMTPESDYNGYAKVRITGIIDASDPDLMTGTVRPTAFATGADVLDLDDPFSAFFGQFNIVELTRIKADPSVPTPANRDYSTNPGSGVWYGTAVADDASSPISEIVIMPHFLPNGSVVWNDSQELGQPHGTGFGDWIPSGTDSNGVQAVGVLQRYDVTAPNSFGGAYKLKFNGQVDPNNPNEMTGSFELVAFTASDIPLPSPNPQQVFHRDVNDTGGESLGTFTINRLRRITLGQEEPPPVGEPTDLQRATINVTLTDGGSPVADAVVELARSASGKRADYAWSGTTGPDGKATIDVAVTAPSASGYYLARATSGSNVIGRWHSIPLNGGKETSLLLQVGGAAIVEGSENATFSLNQNSPNPFNPSTQISYTIPVSGDVHLTIYNSLGQVIRTLVRSHQEAGPHQIQWDGRDEANHQVASGIYFYHLETGPYKAVRGMLMVK